MGEAAPSAEATPELKEVRVMCPEIEFGGGTIEVGHDATLAGLRARVLDEFDEDQLPDGVKEGGVDFCFSVAGDRQNASQEAKKTVWNLGEVVLRTRAKRQRSTAPAEPLALMLTPSSTLPQPQMAPRPPAPPADLALAKAQQPDTEDASLQLTLRDLQAPDGVQASEVTAAPEPTASASQGSLVAGAVLEDAGSTRPASPAPTASDANCSVPPAIELGTSETPPAAQPMDVEEDAPAAREEEPTVAQAAGEEVAGEELAEAEEAADEAMPTPAPATSAGVHLAGDEMESESTPLDCGSLQEATQLCGSLQEATQLPTTMVDDASAEATQASAPDAFDATQLAADGSAEEAATVDVGQLQPSAPPPDSRAPAAPLAAAAPAAAAAAPATAPAAVDGSDDDDDVDEDDADEVVVTGADDGGASATEPDKTHAILERSVGACRDVLGGIKSMIKAAPLMANEDRRAQWMGTIGTVADKGLPRSVVGVLGSTGVGKSSLLNALLGEASILPTSGSRGCTATVVELQYNERLGASSEAAASSTVAVYSGRVEFMKMQDWVKELEALVDEVCTVEGQLYTRMPGRDSEMAHAAWEKIEQVYGAGYLGRLPGSCARDRVLQRLVEDSRMNRILTPPAGKEFNTIEISEGSVEAGSPLATLLATGGALDSGQRKQKQNWALAFRGRINDFVYRKGDGYEPQTWPLIRRVVLEGPWAVLSSGACLVDLPGVKDANAARAKVAERYQRECSGMWIVAPIKRAVDDGTAKKLLGDQFKRRLLMDGQYGNVSFVCTQTDDCEPSEILRDHANVAQRVPGRCELMEQLLNELRGYHEEMQALEAQKEERDATMQQKEVETKRAKKANAAAIKDAADAKEAHAKAEEAATLVEAELTTARTADAAAAATGDSAESAMDVDDDETGAQPGITCAIVSTEGGVQVEVWCERDRLREEAVTARETATTTAGWLESAVRDKESAAQALQEAKKARDEATEECDRWERTVYRRSKRRLEEKSKTVQGELLPICAQVRNEYSTESLQADFRLGLEELCRRNPEDDEDDDDGEPPPPPLPDDFAMDVHCISANDFLKLAKLKSSSDGAAKTFRRVEQTGIPALRAFVHKTTSRRREQAAHDVLDATSNFVDEVKIHLENAGTMAGSSVSGCEAAVSSELASFEGKGTGHVLGLVSTLEQRVDASLKPAVRAGVDKGKDAAMATVGSWGSKDRRTKEQRGGGGLYYSTYFAALRRDGVYTSSSAGAVDFNQELCDPVEKSMTVGWEATMNTAIKSALAELKKQLVGTMQAAIHAIIATLHRKTVPVELVTNTAAQAGRAASSHVEIAMRGIGEFATSQQREINRALLPQIQQRMKSGYEAACDPGRTARGPGHYSRLQHATKSHANGAVSEMFDESIAEMLRSISTLIDDLRDRAQTACAEVKALVRQAFAVVWEDEGDAIDPTLLLRIQSVRDDAAHKLRPLRASLDAAMAEAGFERPQPDVEITDVQGAEQRMADAQASGNMIDLTGDDIEPAPPPSKKVKTEAGSSSGGGMDMRSIFGTKP